MSAAPSAEQNFAALMAGHAARQPERMALAAELGDFDPENGHRLWEELSFGELHARSDALAWGLQETAGFVPGERVLMLVKPSLEFFVLGFALWKVGAVPVLIDPGMGRQGFLDCVRQIRPTALMAIPVGHALSRVFSSSFTSITKRVAVGSGLFGGVRSDTLYRPERGPFPMRPVTADDESALLFTSGSTGPAKAVRYTHGMHQTQARHIGQMYEIAEGEVDVPCFLPFAMFSVSIGMSVALPAIDFSKPAQAEPIAVLRAVQRYGATQLVGSPSLMRRLEAFCSERSVRLKGVKRILTFGAPIPATLHQAFKRHLPEGAEVHTPYGATESLPVATIGSDALLAGPSEASAEGAGTCVGRVVANTELAIIGITEEPINSWDAAPRLGVGEVGEICVKGPQVSREYTDRPEATKAAKIPDGEGFWHRMGDLGYLDAEGRLWFCGRKSHRVTLADGTLVFPVQIEGVVNPHPEVHRSAVVGVRGEAVLIVELEPGARSRGRIERELRLLLAATERGRVIKKIVFHPSFPVDRRHNAKIHRLELAEWARRGGRAA
ncbi:MAG: AMP-binding protein [Alphaproteobacteria bacterium]|nr:AMP-binding protein [Alphaproteobacteria bacterium]